MKIIRIIFTCGFLFLIVSCVASNPQVVPEGQPIQSQPSASLTPGSINNAAAKYDQTFVGIVTTNWYTLLDRRSSWFWARPTEGQVMLKFRLHSDGKITDITVARRSVAIWQANICKKAVLTGEPYEPWTKAMLETVKTNYYDVQIAFKYY